MQKPASAVQSSKSPAVEKPAPYRKPAKLIYGRDDLPPRDMLAILGVQHAVEAASRMTFLVPVLMALGIATAQVESMITASLLVAGLCTILMASRIKVLGFEHLTPATIFISFATPSAAIRMGGLPMLAGMSLFAGLVMVLLGQYLHRWRWMFPPEVMGLIAFMAGASQVGVALSGFLGVTQARPILDPAYVGLACVTVAALAGLTVYGKGRWRLFSSLGTLAAGYVAGSLLGFITPEMWARVQAAAWLDVPHLTILGLGQAGWGHPGLAFSPALVPAFLAFGIGATMKAAGDAAISEKLANADWKRADLKREGPAVLNVGLGSVLSALIGGFPINASSSNIGLSAATGAASRYIGFACGGLLIALTFSPKLMAFLTVAPAPVAGAMFLLVVSYNLIAGMQIIMSRAMEARHTYIIGLSLLIGLSADVMPEAYSNLPDWLRPFFASSMSISTTMVVLLNVLFRIGAGRKKTIRLQPGVETIRRLVDFLENFGADAGARRDVLSKAVSALVEFFESVTQNELTEGPVDVTASFDEFHLNFTIRYHGTPVEIPASRPMISLESTPEDLVRLSGYMLGRLADSVETWSADGVVEIHIKFEH